MAEIIDLNINIGANTTDFEGALQKAQNLLVQFQGALKKATNVGEINYLNTQIKGLEGTISGIRNQMNSVSKPTNDATNALSNLSRVAQDAPYGFIGIANNLNPLLESFQRLQKESGSSSSALKAMVAGLTGPAGIGLALGVVSSLAVTYSKDIAAFFNGPTEKLKKFREELSKLNQDIYKIVGEAQSNRTIGLNLVDVISGGNPTQQQEALKRLKSLYSENKAIQDATVKTDNAFLVHLINVAAIQQDAAGKEKNTQQILASAYAERRKLEAQRDADLKKVTASGGSAEYNENKAKKERDRIAKGYNLLIADLDITISNAKGKNAELINTLTNIETPNPKPKKDSEAVAYAKYELERLDEYVKKLKERVKEAQFVLKYESFKLFELPSERAAKEDKRQTYFDKRTKDLLENTQKEGGFGAFMQNQYKKDKNKIDSDEAEKKRIEDLAKSYEKFANTISQNVTGALFGMYDAMQQGVSATQALGDMFTRLLRQMAEMVVQAAIFAAILSIINPASAGKGGLSFLGNFTKLLGLADGGIATGPTLAMIGEGSESEAVLPLSKLGNMMQTSFNAGSMNTNSMGQNGQFVLKGNDLVLALQRSNYSLNLRRGV
jgi:hypothetical protein